MMIHISSFSTGLSSALATERMLDRYGKENCRIVAMDTLNEEDDNWRFARECEARWGVKIEILTDGRNPLEVAEDHQIIPNQKIHPCTFELKIDPFREWLKQYPPLDLQDINRETIDKLVIDYGMRRLTEDETTREVLRLTSPVTIHIGYDIFEAHRCARTERAYNDQGYLVDFPLLWKPIESRPYSRVVRED